MKKALATLGVLFAVSVCAQPWGGQVTGKITNIDVTSGENYGFRVTVGGTQMCAGGSSWAYLNASDDNYKTYTAVLMMAKALGQTVIISSNLVSGQCKIGFVTVWGA